MPLIDSSYRSPVWLRNGHLQTLWPALFRPKGFLPYVRQRIVTPDNDFIDLDMLRACCAEDGADAGASDAAENRKATGNTKAVMISHGLEGNSQRAYVRGMACAFQAAGWDVIARNMRSCSGEPNRTRRLTHMGDTDDIHTTVLHALTMGYTQLVLVGFSMGGNQCLNYLCEKPCRVPAAVGGAVAISVPCDLVSAVEVLSRPSRRIYMEYFLRTLREKMRQKAAQFEDFPDVSTVDSMRTFGEFDEHFTAPVHGFSSAMDYWTRSSCGPLLHRLTVPTLLINAADDPFLTPQCYPWDVAGGTPHLHLEVPYSGGHVGFVTLHSNNVYWTESRAVAFVEEKIRGTVCPPVR